MTFGDSKLFAVGGWHKGGWGDGSSYKSGEYLDMMDLSGGWKTLPDMGTARSGLGVAFGDGKLFAVGGFDDNKNNVLSGEYLDLTNFEAGWKKLPDMGTARGGLGVAFGDDKLFAVGGLSDGRRVFQKSSSYRSGEYLDLKNVLVGWKKLPPMKTNRSFRCGLR